MDKSNRKETLNPKKNSPVEVEIETTEDVRAKEELGEEMQPDTVDDHAQRGNDSGQGESVEDVGGEREDLLDKLEEAREQTEGLKDRLLRLAADMENLRRRTAKEMDDVRKYGTESILNDLLPVVDNFERALDHLPKNEAASSLAEGVKMVYRQMLDVLKPHGLEGFSAAGKPFDPSLHEAISQEVTCEAEPGTVCREWQKGYLLNGRLLRPAMVIVAKAPPQSSNDEK